MITTFENAEFGKIRTVLIDDQIWFVGRDVALSLGYAKPENALIRHVDIEDKTITPIQGSESNYKSKAVIINESGLYSLILSSKLPKAKQFKRWVTSEVLPSIRKTGAYINEKEIKNLEKRIMKLESKVSPSKFRQYSVGVNTTEIAFSLGTTPKKLFKFLISTGVVYRNWDVYELHDDYVGFEYIQKSRKSYEPFNGRQVRYWTLKGVNLITDLYNKVNCKEVVNSD